jgi:hypothetical protein
MASYKLKVDLIFGEKGIVRGAHQNIRDHYDSVVTETGLTRVLRLA